MTIPPDKRAHFKAGAVICCFSAVMCVTFGENLQTALIVGSASALIAGIVKEVWDHFHPKTNTVETWDALATFGGGLTVSVVVTVMRWAAVSMSLFLLTCGLVGCGPTVPRMPPTGGHDWPSIGSPGSILTTIALGGTALAGIGIIACAVALIWAPEKFKVLKWFITCLVVAAGSQILYWYGQHLALAGALLAGTVVLGSAAWLFVHRKEIKAKIKEETGLDFDETKSNLVITKNDGA